MKYEARKKEKKGKEGKNAVFKFEYFTLYVFKIKK